MAAISMTILALDQRPVLKAEAATAFDECWVNDAKNVVQTGTRNVQLTQYVFLYLSLSLSVPKKKENAHSRAHQGHFSGCLLF